MRAKHLLLAFVTILLLAPASALTEYQIQDIAEDYAYSDEFVQAVLQVTDHGQTYWYIEYNYGKRSSKDLTGIFVLDDEGQPVKDEELIKRIVSTAWLHWSLTDPDVLMELSTNTYYLNEIASADFDEFIAELRSLAEASDGELATLYFKTIDDLKNFTPDFMSYVEALTTLNDFAHQNVPSTELGEKAKEIFFAKDDLKRLQSKAEVVADDFYKLYLSESDMILAYSHLELSQAFEDFAASTNGAVSLLEYVENEVNKNLEQSVETHFERIEAPFDISLIIKAVIAVVLIGLSTAVVVIWFILRRDKKHKLKKKT